jgi:HEAT repeat protein
MEDEIPSTEPPDRPVSAQSSAALQDLAQTFLTLEHACTFYPEGHQARAAPLARLLELLRAEARPDMHASVTRAGDSVIWRDLLQQKPSPVVQKFAASLDALGIARIVWTAGISEADLRNFMARAAAAHAFARRTTWEDAGDFEHLRVEGPDYQALMAPSVEPAGAGRRQGRWGALLARVLDDAGEPSDDDLALLRAPWGDAAELASLLVGALGPDARRGSPEAVARLRRLAALVERAVGAAEDCPSGAAAQRLADLGRRLPPPLRLRLLEATLEAPTGGLFDEAFGSLGPAEAAALLGRNLALDPLQLERLTRVFQTLVPRQIERMELAPLVRAELAAAATPDDPLADNVWEELQELLSGEAGDCTSAAYREQLGRLAAREAGRNEQEAALGELPGLAESLGSAHTAEESLSIQLEQVRLATSRERYRDVLESLTGLCGAALAAGDRARGMRILRRLLEMSAGDEPLAGPRSELGLSLKAVAAIPVARALVALLPSLSQPEREAAAALAALAPETVVPVLLDALAGEEDPTRRLQIATLLEQSGPGAAPLAQQRLAAASDAVARLLLPIVAAGGDPGAAPVLLALLRRGDQKLRRDAVRALLRIDSAEVRRQVPRLLDDADPEIVQAAAAHLGAFGSPETVRELLRALAGGLFAGRRAEQMRRAIFVLGRMRAPEAVAPLGELLRRRAWISRRVREQVSEDAAKALARIGGEAARRELEQAAARGPERVAALCRRLVARPEGE